MSTKNKKNLASQALLEMDAITSAIKEESKNTLNTLLAEAVRNALREGCEEEEDKEYDVVDDEQNDAEENENDSDDSAEPNRLFTITEIIKEVPACADLTNQRVSAIVRSLIGTSVERIEEKRKAFFRSAR